MKLTILTENCAGGKFLAEHGLSYLIEHEGKKVLFDTGHSDVFLKNAQLLGINIQQDIETVVLSHGHWDHGDGLQYLNDKTLITHPGSFIKRYRIKDTTPIGLNLTKQEIENRFSLVCTSEPYEIANNMTFLGEIPRLNDFEAKTTTFEDEKGQADYVLDDSAIVVIENKELIIVTACSHAGICNIIDYACKVTGIKEVKSVIGGFHLKHNNEQTKKTIKYLKKKKIENVYPSHCTELEALLAFSEVFQLKQVKTGTTINL